jgi:hypothetical protein
VAYDVFISYASKDKVIADAVCARLEASGIRCWIAPRDITPGTSYGEAIIEAIHGARVMVLVFSSHANSSGHIPKEVERAVSNGVSIIPFRIEDVAPGKSLDYFIGSVHWLDAMTPPMEKHLDDLASTVHKLLPAKPGEQGLPSTDTSAMWSRSAAGVVSPDARTAKSDKAAHTEPFVLSKKMIWIGVAAVVLMAALIIGVILMRGGDTVRNAGNTPGGVNPAANVTPPVLKTEPPLAPPTAVNPPAPIAQVVVDSIVGCYQWFNNQPVKIHPDGTMLGGTFVGRWRVVNAAQRTYTFTWPPATDTVTISADQRSLSGGNQYGFPTSGTRSAGTTGLAGIWIWANGVPVTVAPNGTFSAATFRGTWRASDASRGIYTLTWPNPVDSVTLSADGTSVSGQNQYGVAISGTKTGPCAGN